MRMKLSILGVWQIWLYLEEQHLPEVDWNVILRRYVVASRVSATS